jgi:predicted DNA-binding protein with PD1-like motif
MKKSEYRLRLHKAWGAFRSGRTFMGRLPMEGDLITDISALCRLNSVSMASFYINGNLLSATYGIYDQYQKVYVTEVVESPLEILSCSGNISHDSEGLSIFIQGAMADPDGTIIGGRIFSPTRAFMVEIILQEIIGKTLERTYDHKTGQKIWPISQQ